MRQLRVIRPVKLRKPQPPSTPRLYGPSQGDLVQWLSHKFAIDDQDAAAIVREVFAYIRGEVLVDGSEFRIHNFGTFRRVTYQHRNPALFGEPKPYDYVRLNAPRRHASETVIKDDDGELLDPEDA